MRVTLSPRAKKLVAAGLVGLLVGLVAAVLGFVRLRWLEGIEMWTYDQRAKVVARQSTASPDIVLIEVSEQDIEDAEDNLDVTWPWPRAMYGYIATYCKTAGAKVVVFDWLFQDRGQYSVGDAEEFAQAMRDAGNVVIGLALTRDPLVARPRSGAWAAPLRTFATTAEAETAAQKLLAWNTRVFIVSEGAGATVWYGGGELARGRLHRRRVGGWLGGRRVGGWVAGRRIGGWRHVGRRRRRREQLGQLLGRRHPPPGRDHVDRVVLAAVPHGHAAGGASW